MENLARYIIRASFSQERITYTRDEAKIVYQSRDGKQQKTFDALQTSLTNWKKNPPSLFIIYRSDTAVCQSSQGRISRLCTK